MGKAYEYIDPDYTYTDPNVYTWAGQKRTVDKLAALILKLMQGGGK
jgi:hypothetical protein